MHPRCPLHYADPPPPHTHTPVHSFALLTQDGVRLDGDATMLLLRYVVKLGCEPSAVGSMVGGISPQDPLFFVLHPIFEKGLHVLWMSPKFRDSYSFEWQDGACNGSKLDDFLPFTGAFASYFEVHMSMLFFSSQIRFHAFKYVL